MSNNPKGRPPKYSKKMIQGKFILPKEDHAEMKAKENEIKKRYLIKK